MLQLAESLNRLGTETAFEVLARAADLAAKGKDVINLGIGQPDFKTPPHIVEAAIKALRDGHHGYTPANGILPLREAVSRDLKKRHGVEVNPGNVVIMPGGKPTMFFAILMFGTPGKEIMYPRSGFSHLPVDDPVFRGDAGADRAARKERLCVLGGGGAGANQAKHQSDHSEYTG